MVQVKAQISFDDLLMAVEQLNSFEREQFVFRIMLKKATPPLPRCDSERLQDKAQLSPEEHPFYQLLRQIISCSAQLTPYAPYIKEVFQYVYEDISLSLAIDAISLIISLPDIEKYQLSIYVLEDSGLVLDFFLDPARVTCVVREQYAHTMWMQDDDVNQYVLQNAEFSIHKVSTHLQNVFKAVLDHKA
ncbi:MAG: hypothetical protein ABFS56_14110 [Pseudomonadota bacterium]